MKSTIFVVSVLYTIFNTIHADSSQIYLENPPKPQRSGSTFSPVRPPAIPLAVRSPYLSAWLPAGSDSGNGGYLVGQWPVHWSGKTLGWAGQVKVDGRNYVWMGDLPHPAVDQISFVYTSTKSIFTMNVDKKIEMLITFFSPVTPNDLMRQSILGSYLDVKVRSIDGKSHDVQIYTDISGEWASGDLEAELTWNTENVEDLQVHRIQRSHPIQFDETDKPYGNGIENWGEIWYATNKDDTVTYALTTDKKARDTFAKTGGLQNLQNRNYRAVSNQWPVFAFAKSFGRLTGSAKSWRFSLGLCQENAIQFLNGPGIQNITSLWNSYFENLQEMVIFFHNDHDKVSAITEALDKKVEFDSIAAGGKDLAIITALSVRQVFGATQFVGNISKPMLFMKEISSNGNMQTVDVIFPMHPILLYFNPNLLKYMLDPLYEQQESGHWPQAYAIHDLGTHYPNATGHPDGNAEEMPVEECGNMIIMTAAYTQRTKDYRYARKHYPLLTQWAQFLVNDSLIPANQLSTDDFAGTLHNQTNLALKGIIGIRAMAVLADQVGNTRDRDYYSSISQNYIDLWQQYGIETSQNPPHTTLSYGDSSSHGLLYNLWCDLELGTKLVPQSVYDMQSKFYLTQRLAYGVPLDTRHTWTKTDWLIYAAAASSRKTSDALISDIVKFLKQTTTSSPFTDLYDAATASYADTIQFKARPVMGASFAPLVAHASS